jgi:hypothetical protein
MPRQSLTHAATTWQRELERFSSPMLLQLLESRQLMAGGPYLAAPPVYQGLPVNRPSHYDHQPSVMYDATEYDRPNFVDANHNGIPDRLYKMAWLGQYNTADPDAAPTDLKVGDRIYMSFSEDQQTWSVPQIVLNPSGGTNEPITADDHLMGAPSMLRIGSRYYMFYEAFSMCVAPINRFYSSTRGDNWVTNQIDLPANAGEPYAFERNLGYAPLYRKANTVPIYSCEVIYHLPGGDKMNRYLSRTRPVEGEHDGGTWSVRNNDEPVMWLYASDGSGRKAIGTWWDGAHWNTYATDNQLGDGVPGATPVEFLGYAAESLDGPDMTGCNQNRVMMATSPDGVAWTRFEGPARGGAVIVPQNEHTTSFNPSTYGLNEAYGSGYPTALLRDGYLELYFVDLDTLGIETGRRVRFPQDHIEQSAAWILARQEGNPSLTQVADGVSGDIKWSPLHHRYFASFVLTHTPGIGDTDPNFRQSATVIWSDADPDPNSPLSFPQDNQVVVPNDGRVAVWGGITGDVSGHTLDRPVGDSRTDFDFYFESYIAGGNPKYHTDIARTSFRLLTGDVGVLAGDANRDAMVDTKDFNTLAFNFSKPNMTFADGDFDTDSKVDSTDFNLFAGNYGKKQHSAAPVAASILSAAGPVFAAPAQSGISKDKDTIL